MNRGGLTSRLSVYALIPVFALLSACATNTYKYDDSPQIAVEQRAVTQQKGSFTVSTSVPSREESEALFGIPLHKRGIQAVWLEIHNNSSLRARFAPYSLDPEYFPPYEVAYMHRKGYSTESHAAMERYLDALSIPRNIPPGMTVSGYVFTHSDPGTKSFNVDIHYTSGEARNENFTFDVAVPGFVPDHAQIDFKALYEPDEIRELDIDSFRAAFEADLVCCTRNHDGTQEGRPINVVFVAKGTDLLRAFLRAGWTETASEKDDKLLLSIDYYFERPPDTVFRKKRDRGTERNEMTLWLAPIKVNGIPVWIAQVKHAIGRLLDVGEYFFGVRLDPQADEGRNYMLQDMWYGQSLLGFAWSATGKAVPQDSPQLDFNGNPWYSDGHISVLWISGEPVSLKAARGYKWDSPVIAEADSE
jgi:hypothetical protein